MAVKPHIDPEEEDADIADFQKEMRLGSQDKVHEFLDDNLHYNVKSKMWFVVQYSDFTGTSIDRANAVYLIKRYPGIMKVVEDQFNHVIVGIPNSEESLNSIDAAAMHSLHLDFEAMHENGVLDEKMAEMIQSEKRIETWNHWVATAFVAALTLRFPGQPEVVQMLAELRNSDKLRAMFEEARDRAGEEWHEQEGTVQSVNIDPIANAVSYKMMQRWLLNQHQPPAAQHQPPVAESLLTEGREFSCLMAPASPELTDAVIRWGEMFISNDQLYSDPKDPGGFGREDEVHVTVKFGLHEAEPSPELLAIIESTVPFEINVGPCSLFENEKFDVVKFDADSDALREMNRRVSELENSDSHPEYHAHMTVAYITKGTCRELIGKPLVEPENERDLRFLVKSVIFSSKNKKKTELFLGKPNLPESLDENQLISGKEVAERLMAIGTAQGGFVRSTLNAVRAQQFELKTVDVRELLKSDAYFEEFTESPYEKRSYEEDGGLRSIEGDKTEIEPEELYDEPIIIIGGEIRDGFSRAADHLSRGDYLIKALVSAQKNVGEADQQLAAVTNKGAETLAEPVPFTETQGNRDDLQYFTQQKASGTNRTVPWMLKDGQQWLSIILPDLQKAGYNAQIVGSVAKHGESEKDLDILLDPISGKHNVTAAVMVLAKNSKAWGRADDDIYNAILPDGHIVEFFFSGLTDVTDEMDWDTGEYRPSNEVYSDEATELPKGSLYKGGMSDPMQESEEDDAMDAEEAKEVYGLQPTYKLFTDADVETFGTYPRIFADRSELIHAPLKWQEQGYQQNATGYGAKLNTGLKIAFNGKIYRLYSTCYGNSGSVWFVAKGRKIFVG